jgi:predicted phosphohydrolase
MSIFVIGDLHLSFNNPKPMDIFGEHWAGHEEKVKTNWIENVKEEGMGCKSVLGEG